MKEVETIRLEDLKTLEILSELPDYMLQGRRMFEYLAQNPKSPTGHVSQACSIGNLSDVANYVNPYLRKHHLMLGCEKPLMPIINKFKERSNQYLWSLWKVPEAANDSESPEVASDNLTKE